MGKWNLRWKKFCSQIVQFIEMWKQSGIYQRVEVEMEKWNLRWRNFCWQIFTQFIEMYQRSDVYQGVTFCLLIASIILTFKWLGSENPVWEPWVNLTLTFAALFNFVVQLFFQKRQERMEIIKAVQHEIMINHAVHGRIMQPPEEFFPKDGIVVYPRMRFSSLDRALASPSISLHHDFEIWNAIFHVRKELEAFNHILLHVETLQWSCDHEGKQRMHQKLIESSPTVYAKQALLDLQKEIDEKTGILGRDDMFKAARRMKA